MAKKAKRLNVPKDGTVVNGDSIVNFGKAGTGQSYAVIPMPDGLTIPLTVKDGEIVVDMPLGRTIPVNIQGGANMELAKIAAQEVNRVIINQSRTGGILK